MTTEATFDREAAILSCNAMVHKFAYQFTRNSNRRSPIEFDDAVSIGQIALARAARDFDPAKGVKFVTYAYYCVLREIQQAFQKQEAAKRQAVVTLECDFFREDGSLADAVMNPTVAEVDDRFAVDQLLSVLTPRYREVIRRRYLSGETLLEVGQHLGITKERVRQLEGKAMKRLRQEACQLA